MNAPHKPLTTLRHKWKAAQPKTTRETITPEVAAEMLAYNIRNRPVKHLVVKKFVERMRSGEWIFTHEGIAFDVNGAVVDGQHRLMAIAECGKPIEINVTVGLTPESYDAIDTESSRSAADLLFHRMPETSDTRRIISSANAMATGMTGSHITRLESVDMAEALAHQIAPFLKELGSGAARHLTRRPAVIAAFVNAVRTTDGYPGGHGFRNADLVMLLAMRLVKQEWDSTQDPMKILFQRMLREEGKGGQYMTPQQCYALTVAALRAALRSQRMTKIEPTSIDWGDDSDTVALGTGIVRRRAGAR